MLVAALTYEARTVAVQNWLADQPPEELTISEWVVTEFSAALSLKVRMRHFEPADRARVLSAFTTLTEESFMVLAVTRLDFRTAARFSDRHATGLRAGDALHLAIAFNHGAHLLSLDRVQIKTAKALGLSASIL